MSKIHVISHSHWDREWYRPFQYFKVRLTYFMDQVLEVLENNENYKHFMLDGQMVMIEDYLTLKPENRDRIKGLVKSGKLIIGPWYSQPDEFAPSGESLVRNLLMGINQAESFGPVMKSGYLPDAFGHCGQMPQILNGFGIKTAAVMRGVPVHKLTSTEFVWEGINGDRVLATAFVTGYSNGMFLPEYDEMLAKRLEIAEKKLNEIGNKDHVLVMDGVDHQLMKPYVGDFLASDHPINNRTEHTTLEAYFEAVRNYMQEPVIIHGELVTPVTNRVHTSIASSRIYQKTENRRLEAELTRVLEPIASIAYVMGANYPKANIDSAWKEMFKNHAHDSIAGCATDEVHREIDQRFVDVANTVDTLKNLLGRSIGEAIDQKALKLVLFNSSLTKGRQKVQAEIYTTSKDFTIKDESGSTLAFKVINSEYMDVTRLSIWTLYLGQPCYLYKTVVSFDFDFDYNVGYSVLDILDGVKEDVEIKVPTVSDRQIETAYFKVDINSDGTLDVYNKATGKFFKGLNAFEDMGCAGDTYNYCPVEADYRVLSTDSKCEIELLKEEDRVLIKTRITMMVPESLTEEDRARSDKLLSQDISSEISLYHDLPRIDVITSLDNKAKDHRVRVLFPSGIETNNALSETHYGIIKRPIKEDMSIDWKKSNWSERPLPIYSQHRFTALEDDKSGLAILNKGLPEYEIYHHEDNTIALTLLRGVGMMGKSNLSVRPGRPSGISLATPDAQCLGHHVFEYSIYPYEQIGDVSAEADRYCSPAVAVMNKLPLDRYLEEMTDFFDLYEIPRIQDLLVKDIKNAPMKQCSVIDLEHEHVRISAIKKAETEEAVILRLYNPDLMPAEKVKVNIGFSYQSISRCNMGEVNIEDYGLCKDGLTINEIRPNSVITLKIYLA